MKIIKKESIGIQPVFNTNVEKVHNYVANSVINHNCVIDAEYQGEIHLSLIYTGHGSVEIIPGMKILQFIETPIYTSFIEVTTDIIPENFYKKETSRKDGGFGSSDNK